MKRILAGCVGPLFVTGAALAIPNAKFTSLEEERIFDRE